VRAPALAFAVALPVGGCAGGDPAAWGVLHGHLERGESGEIGGFAVWELFDGAWGRRLDPGLHRCGRVLGLQGSPADPQGLSGCEGCAEAWALRVVEVDHDCRGGEGSAAALAGMTHLAIGPADGDLSGVGPHRGAGVALWWSWDAATWSPGGVLWDEGLDHGDPPEDDAAWAPGRRASFWPADAWRLDEATLTAGPAAPR
jgi:hypothetical protein